MSRLRDWRCLCDATPTLCGVASALADRPRSWREGAWRAPRRPAISRLAADPAVEGLILRPPAHILALPASRPALPVVT